MIVTCSLKPSDLGVPADLPRDSAIASNYSTDHATQVQLLFIVEGIHDIQFLRRISQILHAHDPGLPDLCDWESNGGLVFLPCGGGDIWEWTERLAPLGVPELHVYDREYGVETASRQRAVARVNSRPGCRAFVTSKRNLENYLAPVAILEARGIAIEFGDSDHVAELVARAVYERDEGKPVWEFLPRRARKLMRERAKHWLNTSAVERMTVERLAARDRLEEVAGWLRATAELAQ
jgi:hypothetical protein